MCVCATSTLAGLDTGRLQVSAIWFIADTDRLVLRPLERMVQLVGEGVSEGVVVSVCV